MKIINKFLFLCLGVLIFVACESKQNQDEPVSESKMEAQAKDMRMVELEIKGMTCEIGCAKLIQSKLYKTDGVNFAQVSFADSTGVIRYDANKLDENDLKAVVEGAGGGDLYRVKQMTRVNDSIAGVSLP